MIIMMDFIVIVVVNFVVLGILNFVLYHGQYCLSLLREVLLDTFRTDSWPWNLARLERVSRVIRFRASSLTCGTDMLHNYQLLVMGPFWIEVCL